MGGLKILPGCPDALRDPDCTRDHLAILAACRAALARRTEAYPGLISTGKLEAETAQADIAAWQHLVAEWNWICTGQGSPPPSWTLFDRIEAIDLAIERAGAALARNPRDAELQRQANLLEAMRWHLSRLRWGWLPSIHFLAQLTHELRASVATCPTCELRPEDPATRACTRRDCGLTQPERTAA